MVRNYPPINKITNELITHDGSMYFKSDLSTDFMYIF